MYAFLVSTTSFYLLEELIFISVPCTTPPPYAYWSAAGVQKVHHSGGYLADFRASYLAVARLDEELMSESF